ncbi:MAG: peptidylprolyl isomerase [Bacteroidota bacterium]|nr:peptidylprolyl isomerase [Bacteroidota bacterium]
MINLKNNKKAFTTITNSRIHSPLNHLSALLILVCALVLLPFGDAGKTFAQGKVIDRVIAVVGSNTVLQSELESQYQQMVSSQELVNESSHCKLFEELLYQKLLLAQAQKDSLFVTDAQVEQELDRRIQYYIQQFGSEERFIAFYGKSVEDFKIDLKDNVRDLLLAQQMQSKITGDVTVTPNDVRTYYKSIPEDSIPFINAEVEVGQIVKKPQTTPEAKKEAKQKIEDIRQRIMKGDSQFPAMAALYSEDPGSASKGGLYEHIQRGQFVPEWDAWAFKLKPNEISEVFETVYGYFIIQLIERRGDEVDARSLLIAPKIEPGDLLKAKQSLDTIYTKISADTISFSEVAAKYSDDEETKNSGGLMVNPMNGATRFQMDEIGQIDQTVAFAIDKLKVGEFTKPMPMTSRDGKQAYRIVYLKTRTSPHRANLADDYQKIQAVALSKKQQEAIQTWIKKKSVNTFVRINDDYKNCTFNNKWIN